MAVISRLSSGGKKSIVLPDNISAVLVIADDTALNIEWDTPNSEVEIECFNIYYARVDSNPIDLSDFIFHGTATPDATTYRVDGLENNVAYYIVVESMSIDGYENASMKNRKIGTPSDLFFVTVGLKGNSAYSENGDDWTITSGLNTSYEYNDVAYGNGTWVAVGQSGQLAYSLNGVEWVQVKAPNGHHYEAVAFGNGRFVAVSSNTQVIIQSYDGVTWEQIGLNYTSQTNYYDIEYVNGKFILLSAYSSTNQLRYISDDSTDLVNATNGVNGNSTTN